MSPGSCRASAGNIKINVTIPVLYAMEFNLLNCSKAANAKRSRRTKRPIWTDW